MLTPPGCLLLNPTRCRVSDAGFGMTGLNGTPVEPLNRLCPFWAYGEASPNVPQPPCPFDPSLPGPLWYR